MKNNCFRNRSGASMIMILSLVGMVLVMSFGVSQIIVNSIRTGVKLENADEAYYVGEGGAEKALKEVKLHEAGYSTKTAQKTEYKPKNTNQQGGSQPTGVDVGNDAYSNFTIEGRVADNPFASGAYQPASSKKFYSVPPAGDGEAGGKDCRDLEPVLAEADLWKAPGMVKKGQTGPGTLLFTDPADHPCNWGVIRPRETVSIPLFVQDEAKKYLNPAKTMDLTGTPTATGSGLGMTRFIVRFRTPCKMQDLKDESGNPITGKKFRPTVCKMDNGSEGREVLEEQTDKFADLILNWQIVAEEWDGSAGDGVSGSLLALDQELGTSPSNSSAIRATFMNSLLSQFKPFMIDEISNGLHGGSQVFVDEFLNISSWSKMTYKPVLKISLNKPLKNNSNSKDPVPYLEYQVISDVRLADPSPLIEVEGFQNGVKQTIKIQPSIEKGILDFAVD